LYFVRDLRTISEDGTPVLVEKLLLDMVAAWATRDQTLQAERMRATFHEDVEFIPPDERSAIRGIEPLIEHVRELTANWPEGVTATLVRPPDFHHDWGRGLLRWAFPGASRTSTDVIRVRDEKIVMLLVFSDPAE
jgi:hypothetical protein